MLSAGDRVIAGVSGGADSVCLLFVLLEYRKKVPFSLEVVHVNHGLREEAGEDADYVRQLCAQGDVPFTLVEVNVKEKAAKEHLGEEEAGRALRYEAFFGQVQSERDHIAVAHHANDRAETFLYNLFRGSAGKGLGSIRPVRDRVIRPLLCLEREEIVDYLRECGISWKEDATNREDHYIRNRIRHHILPYAEEEICKGSIAHINQAADFLALTEDYLEGETKKAYKDCLIFETTDEIVLSLEKLKQMHPLLQSRILMDGLAHVCGVRKDLTRQHVESILQILMTDGEKKLRLPYGIQILKSYEVLRIQRGQKGADYRSIEDFSFDFQVLNREDLAEIPRNQYTKCFDYDKIKRCPDIRFRESGDYFTFRGQNGELIHKSLKEYMITEKIPKSMRDHIPLLALNHHVIWLAGYRISEFFKIDENTKQILQVNLLKNTEDEYGTPD